MHTFNENRYENMTYNRCGNSGLMLSAVSLSVFGTTLAKHRRIPI